MVAAAQTPLGACDGFRVLIPAGLVGWVEETWLGPGERPAGLAVRLLDGRRGLLLAAEIEAVFDEEEFITVRQGGRLLQLGVPHLQNGTDGGPVVSASWRTTGVPLELPEPPGVLHAALLSLHRPPVPEAPGHVHERPIWRIAALLYAIIGALVFALIGLAILVAYLVTGRPPY